MLSARSELRRDSFVTSIAGMAITPDRIAQRTLGGNYDDVILRLARELIGLGPAP